MFHSLILFLKVLSGVNYTLFSYIVVSLWLRGGSCWSDLVGLRRVTDFIPENHICYFITNLVEEYDLKK